MMGAENLATTLVEYSEVRVFQEGESDGCFVVVVVVLVVE
jgi:hypothetical protein